MKIHFSEITLIILIICSTIFSQEKMSIIEGQKLIGMEFTDSEIDSLNESLEEFLINYKNNWKFNLANSIPPALTFNPIPVGFTTTPKKNKIMISDYSGTKLPEDKEDLAYYSIGQLAKLIETKKISSLELTKFFLNRLKTYNPILECVIELTEERALTQASKVDREIESGYYKGLLHGIPFGVKDLLATKDCKTTWGAVPYKDQYIDGDATVIKKLEDAGAVLVAKLTLGALAWGDVWFGGKTKNPWNIKQGSSGSSAGPASATSAGLVPFAIGSETWGSIVSPSTVCGVSGLRPTYGRVSRNGAMALSWSMDKIGPICRNAEDLAIIFNTIYGKDGIDQTLFDYPFSYENEVYLKNLSIGYLKTDFDKDYAFHKNDSLTLEKFKSLGAKLIPIELPEIAVDDISFILSAEAAAAFDYLTRSNKDDLLVRQTKNAWPNVFRSARFIPAVEYINANKIRYSLIQEMEKIMKNIDLFIAPSWEGDNLLLTNLTGHPCVVIPNGFSEDGTPTSITFIGRLFDEGKIISVAKAFQDVSKFHLKRPQISK